MGTWRYLDSFNQIGIDWFGSWLLAVFHFVNSANMVPIVSIVKKQFPGVWDCINYPLKKKVIWQEKAFKLSVLKLFSKTSPTSQNLPL